MSRVYGEPVEVQARDDGRPLRFVWRSRLYTVRAILEHWVINREWWRDPGDSGPPATGPGQPELEFWRVEAAPGQAPGTPRPARIPARAGRAQPRDLATTPG